MFDFGPVKGGGGAGGDRSRSRLLSHPRRAAAGALDLWAQSEGGGALEAGQMRNGGPAQPPATAQPQPPLRGPRPAPPAPIDRWPSWDRPSLHPPKPFPHLHEHHQCTVRGEQRAACWWHGHTGDRWSERVGGSGCKRGNRKGRLAFRCPATRGPARRRPSAHPHQAITPPDRRAHFTPPPPFRFLSPLTPPPSLPPAAPLSSFRLSLSLPPLLCLRDSKRCGGRGRAE